MAIEQPGHGGLAYFPCRYGASRQMFRGPARALKGDYLACLGGDETYGRYIARPFPGMLEEDFGLPVVNLGIANAGPDVFLSDPALLEIVNCARAVVLRMPGALNMSNRYYSVHPMRNDRFLNATGLLQGLFPNFDFTGFHHVGQMLTTLCACDADAFASLRRELQETWVLKMEMLLDRIAPPVLGFWFAAQAPRKQSAALPEPRPDLLPSLSAALVTEAMLTRISTLTKGFAYTIPSSALLERGTQGMFFAPDEAATAARHFPPAAHELAAEMLIDPLTAILSDKRTRRAR
nr:DUF6473 family protein [Pseudooceanicola algae]